MIFIGMVIGFALGAAFSLLVWRAVVKDLLAGFPDRESIFTTILGKVGQKRQSAYEIRDNERFGS